MNCIIVDDEFPSREELKYFIHNFSEIEIKEEFDNGMDALKYFENNQTDVIFLDISMPMLNGIELSKILYKQNNHMKFVFITAYRDYALDAFEVHAFDYLLKPYSKEKIILSLKRLEESEKKYNCDHNNMNISDDKNDNLITNRISVIKDEKIYVIDAEDIYYIEAHGHGTKVYTADEEYYCKSNISEIIRRLNKNKFYKVHRSYIVNLEEVKEIQPWFNGTYVLKMKNINTEIPVSRTNVKEFRSILGIK